MSANRDEDMTPRQNHRSGEWDATELLRETLRRIERKLDGLLSDHSTASAKSAVMDNRLVSLEQWRAITESEGRQFSLGTKLAVLGSIVSPVVVIVFEVLRHKP